MNVSCGTPLTAPRVSAGGLCRWKAINKEGRHVGLDFYDLLIEGHNPNQIYEIPSSLIFCWTLVQEECTLEWHPLACHPKPRPERRSLLDSSAPACVQKAGALLCGCVPRVFARMRAFPPPTGCEPRPAQNPRGASCARWKVPRSAKPIRQILWRQGREPVPPPRNVI